MPTRSWPRYIDTLVGHLDRHPHLPPIMLRELADGGRHLDVETLRQMLTLPPLLFRLVGPGARRRHLRARSIP